MKHKVNFTYSNAHYHLQGSPFNKADTLSIVVGQYLGIPCSEVRSRVATIGDSVNDKPLFDGNKFDVTVGVRNLLPELEQLRPNIPRFVTLGREGEGFEEIVNHISLHC